MSFNIILRKIWSLPRHGHTGIVHSVARLESIYNTVVTRSRNLLASGRRSSSALISDLFSECANMHTLLLGTTICSVANISSTTLLIISYAQLL